jgi:hypothetical protein
MNMEQDVSCREVVITTNATRGKGVPNSPIRRIVEVWEKDGTKIAEHDPCPELLTYTDAVHFARWCQSKECPPGPLGMNMLDKWLEATKS